MNWRWGLGVAALVLAADQLSKLWLIGVVQGAGGYIEVTGFFNLVMVWNRGISFGLLPSEGAGRWVLIGVTGAIVVALLVWLSRVTERWLALSLGLVIGGASGNIIDRVVYGAVADFFDMHAFGYHWPAFNIADSAIVIGVCMLALDALIGRRPKGAGNEIGAAEGGRRRG